MAFQVLRTVYYGVPRFAGEVFRATKAPTLIFLIGIIGVPILLTLTVALAALILHSNLPFEIFAAGIVQILQMIYPGAVINKPPPLALTDLLKRLTPTQLALGRYIFYLLMADAFICSLVMYWWSYRLYKFLSQRRKQKL